MLNLFKFHDTRTRQSDVNSTHFPCFFANFDYSFVGVFGTLFNIYDGTFFKNSCRLTIFESFINVQEHRKYASGWLSEVVLR